MGVLFDCPELVKRLAETTGRDIDHKAYRVELVGNHLGWVTRECEKQVRFHSEPEASLVEAHQGPRTELAADRGSALSFPPKPTVDLMFAATAACTFFSACVGPAYRHQARVENRVDRRHDRWTQYPGGSR
jgi:hypothetical protein